MYRVVASEFWTDPKTSRMTFEEKALYLYLLTNMHTTLSGCYPLAVDQVAYECRINLEKAGELMAALRDKYQVIDYDIENEEILIPNWGKWNWTKSESCFGSIEKKMGMIKTTRFKEYILRAMSAKKEDNWLKYEQGVHTVPTPSPQGGGRSLYCTVLKTDTDTVSDTVSDTGVLEIGSEEWKQKMLANGRRLVGNE